MNTFGITPRFAFSLAVALVSAPAFAQAPTSADPQAPAAPPAGTAAPANTPSAAPSSDVAAPGAAPEKKDDWVDAWAGSAFFAQTGATLNTLIPSVQASKNPTVETFAIFAPRYRINKNFQLRGRLPMSLEWTDADNTTYKNELSLGDASVQLFYSGIKAFPALGTKVKLSPFAGLTFPTSKGSRARTLYVSPSVGAQLAAPFEHVLGGEAMLIANASYSRPIYDYSTAGTTDDRAYGQNCFGGGTACGSQLTGAANPRDVISWSAIGVIEWGDWSPGVFFNMTHTFPYQFSDTPQVIEGSASTGSSLRLEDRSKTRQSTYFSVWLDYHANDWLTPEVGYQMARNLISESGTYGNPFFSQYQDPTFYLGANIQLDSLFKTLRGDSAEGGVVRAQNTQPIRFY